MTFKNELILVFCRLGVAGLAPKAPGTWGTALACAIAPFLYLPLTIWGRVIELTAIFVLGSLAATRAEKILDQKDPGQVVIDELAGVWLALLPFSNPGFWLIAGAFVIFRIFDISKPWPCYASETWLPGGWGVMLDDMFAGLWTMACLLPLYWLFT